jgi:hypothetical protein
LGRLPAFVAEDADTRPCHVHDDILPW